MCHNRLDLLPMLPDGCGPSDIVLDESLMHEFDNYASYPVRRSCLIWRSISRTA